MKPAPLALAGAALLATLATGCARYPLARIPDDAAVSLPDDHAPHAEAQTEWWHVHSTLQDLETGEPLYLFAAFVVERTDLDRALFFPVRLVTNPFHAAYVKIQSPTRSWTEDRYAFPDFWSARMGASGLDLTHGDWRLAFELGAFHLRVSAGRQHLDLDLTPVHPPLAPGRHGRVEIPPGTPHLWSQAEGLRTEGRWEDGRAVRWVEGESFYKHQWGRLYDPAMDGFQWFSLDLDADRSLVVAWLQDDGMTGVPGSMAWVADKPQGRLTPLPTGDVRVQVTRTWKSPRSGSPWPVAWHLTGPGLDLEIESLTDNQELWVFPAPVYTGPATARGTFYGVPVETVAFVEQVGAKQPLLRPFYQSAPPPDRGPRAGRAVAGRSHP